MAHGHVAIDNTGEVVATHSWGGSIPDHVPIETPPGGEVIELDEDEVDIIQSVSKGGQKVKIDAPESPPGQLNRPIKVDGVVIGHIKHKDQ